jgi:hypothetical protein
LTRGFVAIDQEQNGLFVENESTREEKERSAL